MAVAESGAAQDSRPAVGLDAATAARSAAAKTRRSEVVLIGASVCAGFADVTSKGPDGKVNRTYRLDVPFKKVWDQGDARVSNYGDMLMFMDPARAGKRQVQRAKNRKPDLVVAIDFMFWFGYGRTRAPAIPGQVQAERLALQAIGLAQLEGLACPLVLGDYPDASGASSHMLPGRMIPNRATLAALNARLRAWARRHPNVHVFPIARFVKDAVTHEQRYPWDRKQQVVLPRNFLLQSDRLHATRMGTLVIALRVAEFLPRILKAGHPLLKVRPTFRDLVEATGLEAELPVLRPLSKPAAGPARADATDRKKAAKIQVIKPKNGG